MLPSRTMEFGILIAVGGVVLVTFAFAHKKAAAPPPPRETVLPPAKIEDGRAFPPERSPSNGSISYGRMLLTTLGVLMFLFGVGYAFLFYAWSGVDFKHGRPLRVRGRQRLGRHARGDTGWHDHARPCVERLGAWRRARLGHHWLTAARAEHASVPAFQQLGARLAAIGAPDALVARCEAAAADEVRHARRCFAIARTYGGIDWTAGALPPVSTEAVDPVAPPTTLLTTLAVESLVDGCAGEGSAADLARAGAERAADPVIRSALATIADDEAVHAELAWDVVALCAARGGAPVRSALAEAARTLRPATSASPPEIDRGTRRHIAQHRVAAVRARLSSLLAG
jgi:hypothetical protein